MSRSTQTPNEPIRDPEWRFPWGKYKGETIADVIYCNRGYIDWLMQNTDFDVHADLFEEAEARYQQGVKQLFH